METRIESQNKAVLGFMRNWHCITPMDALQICGCFRLSARIYDLRARGYGITTEMVEIGGKRVARYWLIDDIDEKENEKNEEKLD